MKSGLEPIESSKDSINNLKSNSPITSHQIEDILTYPNLLPTNHIHPSSSRSGPYPENILKIRNTFTNEKKMPFFINCIIEPSSSDELNTHKYRHSDVLVEIATGTLFGNFIETVLIQLGFAQEDTINAKGELLLNNWKALPFGELTNHPSKSIYDIFSQISEVPTIKIIVRDYKKKKLPNRAHNLLANEDVSGRNDEVRERIMSLILEQYYKDAAERLKKSLNNPQIRSIEPLDLGMTSFRPEGTHNNSSNDDNNNSNNMSSMFGNYGPMVPPSPGFNIHPGILKTRDDLLRWQKNYFDSLVSNSGVISDPISDADTARRVNFLHGCTKEVPMRNNFLSNRHVDTFTTNKPRMRVCFDPETEIPRLQKWFAANNHPTRQQVEEFVKELNSLECRKGRKALDVNNVIYWFKNTRAAVKRAEMKSKQNPSIPQPTSIHPPVSSSSSSSNNNFLELRSNSPSTQSSMHWPWLSSLKNNNDNYSLPSNFATEKLSSCEVHTPQKESIIMEAESSTKESSINDDRRSEDEDEEGEDIESKQRDSSSKSELTSELLSPSLKEDDSLSYRPSSLIYPPPPHPPPSRAASSNPLLSHSVIYMSQYMNPYLQTSNVIGGVGASSFGLDSEKRKRNRTFIDPVSEVPRLEEWFLHNTHPSHSMIARYTDELNRLPYRQKFPSLEQKNIQFWFKNRRAKCKRMNSCL